MSPPGAGRRASKRKPAATTYVVCAVVAMLIAVRIGVVYPAATTIALLVIACLATGLCLLVPRPLERPLPPTRHVRHMKIDDTLF
ncbi:hypothetical protein [Phenylobacterium sp.]|uniref:hypothetical protein n=1 Tax=Phenylobacterium sp. TaxID=1871053 RepID=UPI003566AC97